MSREDLGFIRVLQPSSVGRWTQPGCVVLVKIASLKAVSFESVPASFMLPAWGVFVWVRAVSERKWVW